MEDQVLTAARRGAIELIVLRYGLFYGAGTPSTDEMIALVRRRRLPTLLNDRGPLPFIYLSDAVAATVAALEHGSRGASTISSMTDHRVSTRSSARRRCSPPPRGPSRSRCGCSGWRSRTWPAYSRWIWRSRMPPHAGICNGQRGFRATAKDCGRRSPLAAEIETAGPSPLVSVVAVVRPARQTDVSPIRLRFLGHVHTVITTSGCKAL